MRRLYTFILFSSLSLANALAQYGTGFVGNGYYRVHNFATDRYIYVTDNKDYYDESRDAEDFQAIQLWKDAEKTISDPASVIYIRQYGDGSFNLQSQGTGVKELTGYSVKVDKKSNGTYEVSAKRGPVTKYLSDDRSNSNAQGVLGTSGTTKYRRWVVDKIETNHATNYFGVKPTIEYNGKFYQPFFAAFPFKTASPDMHVYYINKVAGHQATLQEIDGVIPDSTAVIIECASANPSDNRLEILPPSKEKLSGNQLKGVYFCNGDRPDESTEAFTEYKAATMRLLTVSGGKLVLSNNAPERLQEIVHFDWDLYDDVNYTCIPANTCYMMANAGTPDVLNIRFVGVGIDEILAEKKNNEAVGVYTLSGTQLRATNDVKGLPAGLYIVGGVKVAIK